MPTITLPACRVREENSVLEEVTIYSDTERTRSGSNYVVIEACVRREDKIQVIGTYRQDTQTIPEGEAIPILEADRARMRLKKDEALVVRITTTNYPTSLQGMAVDFVTTLVGNESGTVRPLVSVGTTQGDVRGRSGLDELTAKLNVSGVARRTYTVALTDPLDGVLVRGAALPTFQGRVQVDSTTTISLRRYTGDVCVVNDELVSIGESGLSLTTSVSLIDSNGAATGSGPGSGTLYCLYLGNSTGAGGSPSIRLSSTLPSLGRGGLYLGTAGAGVNWRFIAYAYLNGSTQFVSDTTNRNVINYYNRRRLSILLRPGYQDDNAADTFTETSTTWTAANAGSGSTGSYVANGEDAVEIHAFTTCSASAATGGYMGIGDNSTTTAVVAGECDSTVDFNIAVSYRSIPAAGYRTVSMLTAVTGGTTTYDADEGRMGSATDVCLTALTATVMG